MEILFLKMRQHGGVVRVRPTETHPADIQLHDQYNCHSTDKTDSIDDYINDQYNHYHHTGTSVIYDKADDRSNYNNSSTVS